MTIAEITKAYRQKIDYMDLELIIAHSLGKPREFVLAHPEKTVSKNQESRIKKFLFQRIQGKPIAYITGRKEFCGLDFIVNKDTLVPRPETELLVEQVIQESSIKNRESCIVDVGTGSGNIIISIAKSLCHSERSACLPARQEESRKISTELFADAQHDRIEYFAIDISKDALKIAEKNAKMHGVDKEIKFLYGNLITPAIPLIPVHCSLFIVANLPYLSKKIYASAPADVRKYEPKTALYSLENGLQHYSKLLQQIKKNIAACSMRHISCFFEISPEQKNPIGKIIRKIFPKAKISFEKDLAGRWRVCKIDF